MDGVQMTSSCSDVTGVPYCNGAYSSPRLLGDMQMMSAPTNQVESDVKDALTNQHPSLISVSPVLANRLSRNLSPAPRVHSGDGLGMKEEMEEGEEGAPFAPSPPRARPVVSAEYEYEEGGVGEGVQSLESADIVPLKPAPLQLHQV